MKNNKKIIYWDNSETVSLLIESFNKNNFFIGSTDTILGFFMPVTLNGFKLLNELKGRQDKPYLILVKNTFSIKDYVNQEDFIQIEKIAAHFWPGPLTIVAQAYHDVPEYVQSKEGTIAFRSPDHKGIQELLNNVLMIFSTSLNKTGQKPPLILNEIDEEFLEKADYWVLDENLVKSLPSTIIEIKNGNIKLVREGAIEWVDIIEKFFI